LPDWATAYLAEWHLRATRDARLPKVSAMSLLERGDCLGCQAGFTFFYVATDGEVYPCDLAPISFGRIYVQGVPGILRSLASCIRAPSQQCLARRLNGQLAGQTSRPIEAATATGLLAAHCSAMLPSAMDWVERSSG
jgi:hypothetical protein